MEFNEKLQELRKSKDMTQEELSEALFVSRTAISKWESGRGYPSIDSLKIISEFFSVSVDELLSSSELMGVAQKDYSSKMSHMRDLVFGLLDCAVSMFLFLPFFGQVIDGNISEVGLLSLTNEFIYIKVGYYIIIFATIICGIITLALQNCNNHFWLQSKSYISVGLSIIGAIGFMLSRQPYAAVFTFIFLIIKGILLIKHK